MSQHSFAEFDFRFFFPNVCDATGDEVSDGVFGQGMDGEYTRLASVVQARVEMKKGPVTGEKKRAGPFRIQSQVV